MSLKTRGLIFATFFGNCIVVGLLVASFTTDHWIEASAKRSNSTESEGRINFGLFLGSKDLNVAYGWRNHKIHVPTFIRSEPDVMNYWLWLSTAVAAGFGLFSSAVGSVASVIKSASSLKKRGTMVLLFISNIASAVSQMISFICWLVHFYQYLTHNVLSSEDRANYWFTTGYASLGHSFYFVVIGTIIVIINIILLLVAVHLERRERRQIEEPCDEKTQGAIMLY